MPDQSTQVLDLRFDDPAREGEFRVVRRGGYDPAEVDAYVAMLRRQIQEMRERSTPHGAVRKRLEEVGDEVAGILQRAHETAREVTETAERDAEQIVSDARREVDAITERAESRVAELDADTDRIWIERDRIVADARDLAGQLSRLADAAADRFPAEHILDDAGDSGDVHHSDEMDEETVDEADIVLDDEGD